MGIGLRPGFKSLFQKSRRAGIVKQAGSLHGTEPGQPHAAARASYSARDSHTHPRARKLSSQVA